MSALESMRRLATTFTATRGRLALAWGTAALLLLAALAGGPGVSRDEAAAVASAGDAARPSPPRPSIATDLARAARAAGTDAGLPSVRSARLPSVALGALLAVLLAVLGWDLAGRAGALLAPALFWLAPRHLHAGLTATPEIAVAALSAALALAYRRSSAARDGRRALGGAAVAGVLFGLAVAARADAWVLLPAIAIHSALVRAAGSRAGAPPARAGARWALLAMAILGPAVAAAAWGVPWRTPLAAAAAAFAPVPRQGFSPLHPFAVAVLALPATFLCTYAAGLAHAAARLRRALRERAPAGSFADDVLLVVLAAVPFAAAASRAAPALPGARPWLAATPFLALLGARALLAAARSAWPSRAPALAGALAILVLYPALRLTAHVHPAGASAWNEIAGGAPGAASLGMRRQDGGEAAAALLPEIAARARSGARIWWAGVDAGAVRLYAKDGRLRPDLVAVDAPEDADIAVVALDGGSRDAEYRAWTAFRTSRTEAGAYLDEVPLALVYARPGTWR